MRQAYRPRLPVQMPRYAAAAARVEMAALAAARVAGIRIVILAVHEITPVALAGQGLLAETALTG